MKNKLKVMTTYLIGALLIFSVFSCSKNEAVSNNSGNNGNTGLANMQTQVNSLPKEPLSPAELTSILFMREEEKLARDVYLKLNNKWGSNIFLNISNSEQTHMDAVLLLINKYGLTDPAVSNPVGVFSQATLQNLYDQLLTLGNTNLSNAYQVGANIEDLDIYDLTNALKNIDNQDIRLVYDMLTKGSRNHMRSFYKNILNVGSTYIPQYITQSEFEAIINSPMETGF